jgi:uncharacterized repeat protein (TIGR02543 family)
MWSYYLPECTMDTYSGYISAGTLPTVSNTVKTPQIYVTQNGSDYIVTIDTDTQGADIYYTIDGSKPSSSDTRSVLYTTSFSVKAGTQVRAIAVADKSLNSEEVSVLVQEGTSGTQPSDAVKVNSGDTDSTNPGTTDDTQSSSQSAQQQAANDMESQTPGDTNGLSVSGNDNEAQEPGDIEEPGRQTYQITYQLDGGTNSAENPSEYDGLEEITLNDPTKTGYTFKGWYIQPDYLVAMSVIKEGMVGNITLYAKWVPNTYKIVFKGNGSTKGTMVKLSCKYGNSYKLTANKFKRTGYTFNGWNTKANGKGTSYKNKASVKNLTTAAGKKVTLYAQWKKK